MKNSQYIKTIDFTDPEDPNKIVQLDVHKLNDNYVAIESSFSETVANYILNPYEDCELIKLADPQGNDDVLDPPVEEDELIGFLKIIVMLDKISHSNEVQNRDVLLSSLAKKTGLETGQLEFLFGLARNVLEDVDKVAFQRFLKALQNNNEGL